MGCFSFMFADANNRVRLKIGGRAYVPFPEKEQHASICEERYFGYGMFGRDDIYDLVADWNREYLANHPGHVIPSTGKRVNEYSWYPYYSNLALDSETVVELWDKVRGGSTTEYRQIGIDISVYDEDNAALPYPFKVCMRSDSVYENVPASKHDPDQGCD